MRERSASSRSGWKGFVWVLLELVAETHQQIRCLQGGLQIPAAITEVRGEHPRLSQRVGIHGEIQLGLRLDCREWGSAGL
jgi:hypothetical protein